MQHQLLSKMPHQSLHRGRTYSRANSDHGDSPQRNRVPDPQIDWPMSFYFMIELSQRQLVSYEEDSPSKTSGPQRPT